ncbi:TlpA family protein disulfide reductase [Jatrophihabitans sp. YIM 134969]
MNTFGTRARAGLAAALGAVLLVGTGCSASKDAVDPIPNTEYRFNNATSKGEVIPESDRKKPGAVTGELLDGKGTYSLANDAGKVVVVNLWGSWCGPCKVETPQYQQVYLDSKAQGVQFVGFDVKDNRSDAQAFVEDNQITYPNVYDQAAKVALQLGGLRVAGLPNTVLIDKQGRVAAAYVGIVQPSQLKPAIATLVAES